MVSTAFAAVFMCNTFLLEIWSSDTFEYKLSVVLFFLELKFNLSLILKELLERQKES